ncbi:hypothetical protein [Pseudoalteromonas ostreae]|uniref:hypothetical protein n=1 Tax=Pseudoalteromonas ostreae TaxID=2774154 RepID=UPI001B37EA0D|nr:hypothetical protein [Pseudoalteromonas ostreae]
MSNVIHRIVSHAMLFTLLMSVSLTVLAQGFDDHDHLSPTINYIACDIPDQANFDVDLDTHVNGISIRALQPLPENILSLYVSTTFVQPFSYAYQRGPPTYFI